MAIPVPDVSQADGDVDENFDPTADKAGPEASAGRSKFLFRACFRQELVEGTPGSCQLRTLAAVCQTCFLQH